jgi:hypothetical protein
MRQRHSLGGVRKQRGRWIGLWYEDGKKKSRVIGLIKEMTKGEAREAVSRIITEEHAKHEAKPAFTFGQFVENAYFPYYTRKWKDSTRENNVNRVSVHLVRAFRDRVLSSFRRDELQDLLDGKAKDHSFSVVDHLRWDLKQIFDMANRGGAHHPQPGIAAVHAEGREKAAAADHEHGASANIL